MLHGVGRSFHGCRHRLGRGISVVLGSSGAHPLDILLVEAKFPRGLNTSDLSGTIGAMLSFLQHLDERFTRIPIFSAWAQSMVIRGHVNPSASEIHDYLQGTRHKDIRYLYEFTTRTLYLWDAALAIHKEVIDGFPIEQQDANRFFYGNIMVPQDRSGKVSDPSKLEMTGEATEGSNSIRRFVDSVPAMKKFAQTYDVKFVS